MTTRQRTRPELAEFLKNKRENISPEQVGLPHTNRRRTPGLRREEVAALAGVGLTWYTWLEQGRDIGVSTNFLDQLSVVLQLNRAERQHLYLLAQNREPLATGHAENNIPNIITRIMDDLPNDYLCYVLNLHWDVLAYNDRADHYFHFSQNEPHLRNFLYLLFMDHRYQQRFVNWSIIAEQQLASFRRDYARTKDHPAIKDLITLLTNQSELFSNLWDQHQIYQPCTGIRELNYNDKLYTYSYSSLTFDVDKGSRLLVYAPIQY